MKNDDILKSEKENNNNIITTDFINLAIYNLQILNNKNNNLEDNKPSIDYQSYVLNSKLDNFFSKLEKNKIFSKKLNRVIEYINKIIISQREIKYNKNFHLNDDKIFKITRLLIYIIKNNINAGKHSHNEKLYKILFLQVYLGVFPMKNLIIINNIFLNSAIRKIENENKIIDSQALFDISPLNFINDLFQALTTIPCKFINKNTHIKLIDELILILDNALFSNSNPYNLQVNKLTIWFKLLGNKILSLDKENPLLYNKLISFLVKIYKYNFQNLFYFNSFYEKSAISFDYYINSLDFLFALFKEEENFRKNKKFKIKNGFYIYNNMPLTLNEIKFKKDPYSLIFSFKLTNIPKNKENTILLNFENNNEKKKDILKLIINNNDRYLKIIDNKNNEWNSNIPINLNKDYLVCISQEDKFIGNKLYLFLNNEPENNEKGCNNYLSTSIGFPNFDQNMTLYLGKSNFEGIFGEVIIMNKMLEYKDINHLYNLKENYADIICSLNNKYDFTYKSKKFTDTNEDIIFFKNLKYQCNLKIQTYHIHSILNNSTSVRIKPYGELKYNKIINDKIINSDNLKVQLYTLIYSIENFFNQHGLEFLIFQLHRIVSLSETDESLNFYLCKTLQFLLEYITMATKYIFPVKDKRVKTEKKYINFSLSLITVLYTKKRKFELDEKIRDILLEYSKFYRKKKVTQNLHKINFSILLDNKLFKKSHISYYNKILDEIILYIDNDKKEKSLLYKEILYKYLLLDDILESKEIKHKQYMQIFNYFLIGEEESKNKDTNAMLKIFIRYFSEIKSPKKMYHYLKYIYLNIDSIKPFLEDKENGKFVDYLFKNEKNIIDTNNNKYNEYNQILYFLLHEKIKSENSGGEAKKHEKIKNLKNEKIKNDNNNNNNKNQYSNYKIKPNYNFIKCLFIQFFNIDNKIKLNFIKASNDNKSEMEYLKNSSEIKKNILSMLDYSNFVSKLNSLINYYYYIYNEYLITKDKNIEILLKKNIKLIFDFLDEISNIKEFKLMETNNNYSADNIIIPKKNKNDLYDSKKTANDIYKFINDLFSSSGLKLLFIIYFNLYEENELNNLKHFNKYIEQSIDKIYNPFYFYLLLSDISLNSDIKKNNNYKTKIFEKIINNIIIANINIKNKSNYTNNTLALNSIIILIRIYHITQFEPTFITHELENSIINYMDYIFDNFFIYSKIVFDINIIDDDINQMINNNTKEVKFRKNKLKKKYCEYKLILEIALDIIFSLLINCENKELNAFIYKNLMENGNNSIFFKIDEFYFTNNNNHSFKYNMIFLLNCSKIITDYCSGISINNVLHSIYFLIYFIYKKNMFFSLLNVNKEKEKEKKINEIINIIDKLLEILFKNCINTFKIYKKKIKKYKSKIASNEIIDKAYDIILEYFASKYKNNNILEFSEGNEIFKHFTTILQKKSDDMEKNKDKMFSVSLALRSQSNLNDFSSSSFSRNASRKGTYINSESYISEPQSVRVESKFAGITNFFKKRDRSISENNDDIFLIKHSYNNFNFDINPNKIDEVLSGENSIDNQSLDMTKEAKIECEASQSSIPVDKSLNLCIDSSEESASDEDNKLKPNSNYKIMPNNPVKNSINMIIDKENEINKHINKINLYLNKKSSNSSENLRHKKLSTDKKSSDEFMRSEVKRGKKRETTKILPIFFANSIIINEDDEHTYLNDKLDKIDIPFSYYRKLNVNKDPKWGRIIFNPKRALFKIFGFAFKNYIFNNRRFNKLKKVFKIVYKNIELEKSIPEEENYSLNYPSKLKNFTCADYYKPFLKPMLNFFENEYFESAHSFIKNDIFLKDLTEKDKFCKINYAKLEMSITDKNIAEMKYRARCENISNKGSIFGVIYFLSSLMIFKDNSDNDERQSENISESDKLFFIFSSDISDRLTKLNKCIVLYYSEIKELILRKFYFNEIAYEIFMKDGRSYFFNFFTKKNREKFYDNFITKINRVNATLKKEKKIELDSPKIYKYDSNYVNLELIEEPKTIFEKNDFRAKYAKNEISNFQYLLLINKFSSRTYNDCNQYLIFPLLYMDVEKKKERDLSKPICLNKEKNELDDTKYINNFETMGYHFNIHYSTMAYVLYYLMRIIPFTFSQIKLQSGHFDAPSRMFTSLENLLFVFKVSDENRELLPEFFYSYESFLNLNYNNFGYTKTNKKQINHFSTSQNCGIVEFIIDLRKILEKKELSDWINNIFGSNQLNDNFESFNKFPSYSYEQLNSFKTEKENLYSEIGEDELDPEKKIDINKKINDLKARLQLLSLGLTPSQLFKSPHPLKEKISKKPNNKKVSLNESNNSANKNKIGNFIKKKKSNSYMINKYLKDYINKTSFNNILFVFNNNDNDNLKIIFIFEKIITIYNFESESGKDIQCKNIELEDETKFVDIKPYKNTFVELYENVFLICRLINKTLLLYYGNQKVYIEWPCIVTSIEFYSHDEVNTNYNSEIHLNKVIVGDEEGTLSLIEIETECNERRKEYKLNVLNYIHKRYKAFYSYINGILYNKKLNIIISSSNEGIISIINGFSFEILNIIELDNNINILDYKLSEYNLLYIYTNKYTANESKYNLYCYTLNGIKISELSSKIEYVDFYTDNNGIITINKNGIINEYNCANLKEIENNLDIEDINDIKDTKDIIYCMNSSKMESIFIIFNKNIKTIRLKKEM